MKQTREALRASEEQLRIADKRKDEFIATLAHELRNPLGTIAYAASLIAKSDTSDPTVKWGSEVIDRQLKHITRLLDDLLDVARISTGKIGLDRQRIELADVLKAAIESSKPLIERFSHTFEVHLPSEPALLDADSERLTQVFMNLLTNAAKYTDPGGRIYLEANVQGDEVTVSVKDTGTGIAADKLPYVFDMFFQTDGGTGRTLGGLGIGLSIAKQLVELHGGSLEAFSAGLGRGSEFIVRLPLLHTRT